MKPTVTGLIEENGKEPAFKRFYGEDPRYGKALQTFGEMAVVADIRNKATRTAIEPGTDSKEDALASGYLLGCCRGFP